MFAMYNLYSLSPKISVVDLLNSLFIIKQWHLYRMEGVFYQLNSWSKSDPKYEIYRSTTLPHSGFISPYLILGQKFDHMFVLMPFTKLYLN